MMAKRDTLFGRCPQLRAWWSPQNLEGKKLIRNPERLLYRPDRAFVWQCENGHAWVISVGSMEKNPACPYCNGDQVWHGDELAYNNRYLAHEWSPENKEFPQWVSVRSRKIAHWVCSECGLHWTDTVANRMAGADCPKCSEAAKQRRRRIIEIGVYRFRIMMMTHKMTKEAKKLVKYL